MDSKAWKGKHRRMNPMLKEALQTMFDTGLPAIIYEELTDDQYKPVDGVRHIKQFIYYLS